MSLFCSQPPRPNPHPAFEHFSHHISRSFPGYDTQMQTNHLSHFLLTKELLPLLNKAANSRGEARVVNHSSGARSFPSTPLHAKYLGKNGGNLGGNGNSMLFGGARWQRYHQVPFFGSHPSFPINIAITRCSPGRQNSTLD